MAFDDVVRDVMSAAMVDASASTLKFPAPRGGSTILSVRGGATPHYGGGEGGVAFACRMELAPAAVCLFFFGWAGGDDLGEESAWRSARPSPGMTGGQRP